MAFWDKGNKFPYTNNHDANLDYMMSIFENIKNEWHDLYVDLVEWKGTTTLELNTWKTNALAQIEQYETDFRAEIAVWKANTEQDIGVWEQGVLADLGTWRANFETLFATTFSNLTQIKTDAEAARDAAAESADAALESAEQAESSAESVSSALTQIATNAEDISDLKTQLNSDDWFNDAAKPLLMTGNGTWEEPDSRHICLDIKSGDVVKVKANTTSPAVYGFLKNASNISAGTTVDFSEATGFTSRIVLAANTSSADTTAPSDAQFICFNLLQGAENHVPVSVIINGIEMIDSIRLAIKNINNRISAIEADITETSANIKNKYDEIIIKNETEFSNFDISKLEYDNENFITLKEGLSTVHTNALYFKNTKFADFANADIKIEKASDSARFVFEDVKENAIYFNFNVLTVGGNNRLYIAIYNKNASSITNIDTGIDIVFSNKYHNIKVAKLGYTYFFYFDNVYCGYSNMIGYIDNDIKKAGFSFRGNIENPSYYKNHLFDKIGSFVHFSYDDQIAILKDISDNAETYTSIFDNEALAGLKRIHDKYWCVYTLECLLTDDATNPTFTLANMTTKFKSEFQSVSEWLKFAYHGPDPTTYPGQTMTAAQLVTSVQSMYNAIRNFAGENSIDKTPRMSYFNCTKEQAIAMRENNLIVGLLTADDNRTENVGLDSTERAIMQNYDTFTDFSNKITYFRSELRMDNNTTEELIAVYDELFDSWRNNKQFVIFGHHIFSTLLAKTEAVAKWAFEHNMKFDYPQNYTMWIS